MWITATLLVKELIAGLFSEDYARPIQRKIVLLLLEILKEVPPLTMALPMPGMMSDYLARPDRYWSLSAGSIA